MRVYISGKIGEGAPSTGTLAKFKKAEEFLLSLGHEVFNPTTSGLGNVAEIMSRTNISLYQEKATSRLKRLRRRKWYDCILLLDMEELSWCDAIYMLPDFLDSKGAKAEHAFAIALGLEVIYDEELYNNGIIRRC